MVAHSYLQSVDLVCSLHGVSCLGTSTKPKTTVAQRDALLRVEGPGFVWIRRRGVLIGVPAYSWADQMGEYPDELTGLTPGPPGAIASYRLDSWL